MEHSLEALFFGSPDDEAWLSEQAQNAFGIALALDNFCNPSMMEIRVASSFDGLQREDRTKSRNTLLRCERLDEQGDGLRSFVSTLGALKNLTRSIFLIDEPEAFLHPPQAYIIGKSLGSNMFAGKQIICSTHSSDFLRGVLSSDRDATVIRISRSQDRQSVTKLDPDRLRSIIKNPVLSSGRVLDGLFYKNVIITESDGDAVMYAYISSRIDVTGETYYVNSYSKQATKIVAEPYRNMKIPYAAIVDLDLIRVVSEFTNVAKAFFENTDEVEGLAKSISGSIVTKSAKDILKNLAAEIEKLLRHLVDNFDENPDKQLHWVRSRLQELRADTNSWADVKKNGVNSANLKEDARDDLKKLILLCASNGLFLVPCGERESWLTPQLPYTKNKSRYTDKALEYLSTLDLSADIPLSIFMKDVHAYLRGYGID